MSGTCQSFKGTVSGVAGRAAASRKCWKMWALNATARSEPTTNMTTPPSSTRQPRSRNTSNTMSRPTAASRCGLIASSAAKHPASVGRELRK